MIAEKQAIALFDDYLTGNLGEAEAILLLDYLKSNPRFGLESYGNLSVDYLLRRRKPHDLLKQDFATLSDMDELARQAVENQRVLDSQCDPLVPNVSSSVLKPLSSREHKISAFLILLLLLCFVFGIYSEFRTISSDSATASPTVARVVECIEAQWENGAETFKPGSELEPSFIKLRSGVVKLEFGTGAEVVLEGPVEFLVKGDNLAFCQRGKLSAYVPPRAAGFEVASPTATVIDRGTAFSMEVLEEKAEVHVVNGNVEVNRIGNGPYLLPEGMAALFGLKGEIGKTKADPETYFSEKKLQSRKAEYVARRRAIWDKEIELRQSDPSLIFRFEPDEIKGMPLVPGSRSDQTAVRFQGPRDRIPIFVSESCESLTMIAMVRLGSMKNFANTLIMGESFETTPGRFHWQLNRFGALQLHLNEGEKIPSQYASPSVVKRNDLHTWITIAVVADARSKTITHYFEGSPVASLPWKPHALHVGRAAIGNEPAKNSNRFFFGDIEDFWIFSRPFSDHEIMDFYSNNR